MFPLKFILDNNFYCLNNKHYKPFSAMLIHRTLLLLVLGSNVQVNWLDMANVADVNSRSGWPIYIH